MENTIETLERRIADMQFMLSELTARLAKKEDRSDDIVGDMEDCSRWLKRSPSTIYKMTSQRKIPHFKNGKRLLFKKSEILAWLEKDRQYTEEEFRSDVDERLQQHAKSPWRR